MRGKRVFAVARGDSSHEWFPGPYRPGAVVAIPRESTSVWIDGREKPHGEIWDVSPEGVITVVESDDSMQTVFPNRGIIDCVLGEEFPQGITLPAWNAVSIKSGC